MYRNRCLLSLQMSAQDHDATQGRTLDRSGNAIHASFGAAGALPTKIVGQRGYSLDGGDYMTGACNGAFNQAEFSASFLFAPTFAANDGANHYLFDTSDTKRYLVLKTSSSNINVWLGNTDVLTVAGATFGPYWKVDQYNTLTVTGTSGDNQAVLNGVSIGTSATAWVAANPASYWIGCRSNSTLFFAGRFYQMECRPIRMTMLHALDWHINALKMVNAV